VLPGAEKKYGKKRKAVDPDIRFDKVMVLRVSNVAEKSEKHC